MINVELVKQQAIQSRKILENFFCEFPNEERDFRVAFHLRPTSNGNTTIVSTLPIAPMRGISNISNSKLNFTLMELRKILFEPSADKQIEIMDSIGFKKRKSVSMREEDVQAALIRDMGLSPELHDNKIFLASEFALFEYGENADEEKRPDVLAFKDGILYDIELKNERLTETVRQVAGYVKHIKKHLSLYANCLIEFPNNGIEIITDVKGIALVPYSEKSNGGLEKESASLNVELWFFDEEYRVIKNKSAF